MLHIGVAAHSSGSDAERAWRFVSALPGGVRVLLGGYWGVMRDVAEAARRRGLTVVFFLPVDPPAEVPDDELFVRVDTGLDLRGRSVALVRSSDALAVLGGEVGTVVEAFLAYSYGKPVAVLRGTGLSSDALERAFPRGFDGRGSAPVVYVDTPEELAARVVELAASRRGRR
ncbi:SLOG cluster 4 domain-containing protein [Thermofilum pendens]|uniref:SLOG cluster 4 domain-containing protein n=1 Tax=Thermofilum pendens TaxID=2269 RepID=UPI00069A5F57|nr:hypothetical protein [Thermofilum pendens]